MGKAEPPKSGRLVLAGGLTVLTALTIWVGCAPPTAEESRVEAIGQTQQASTYWGSYDGAGVEAVSPLTRRTVAGEASSTCSTSTTCLSSIDWYNEANTG